MNTKIISGLLVAGLSIGSLGCGLFSTAGDAEVVFAATEVGTPEGAKISKSIGPEGGTLTSPDGRMTLTVPQGALTETIPFSMQPISNKADGGLGLAYRLEPDGATFTNALEISVRYDDNDLKGTVPEALSLAYQDKQGAWHEVRTLARTEDTVTIAASHFTDWSFLAKMRLEPPTATIRAGESIPIALVGCAPPAPMWFKESYRGDPHRDRDMQCKFGTVATVRLEWFADIGTIENGMNPSLYTAPSKKPTPNIATVAFPYQISNGQDCITPTCWRGREVKKGVFTSRITIVDGSYSATGSDGPTSYSGTICGLDKQFTVTARNGPVTYTNEFTPSGDGRTGNAISTATLGPLVFNGSGSYAIEGFDGDNPKIVFKISNTLRGPGAAASGSGTAHIVLVPLETEGCN